MENLKSSLSMALAVVLCLGGAVAVAKGDAVALAGAVAQITVPDGHGSGVHLGNGLFLTANHVVENEDSFRVYADNGMKFPAEVVWTSKLYDLAAVRISGAKSFEVSKLECSMPKIGDPVHGIGYPIDLGKIEVWGHVAGPAVTFEGAWKSVYTVDMTTIPGMSGGPLYDSVNHVIGIMVGVPGFRNRPVFNLGFVVPSTVACDLMAK